MNSADVGNRKIDISDHVYVVEMLKMWNADVHE